MSSNTSKSKVFEDNHETEYKLSEIVITFKDLINRIEILDIYSGNEDIPFREKDEEFQRLLLGEFKT